MNYKVCLFLFILISNLSIPTTSNAAITYSAVNDFSNTTNNETSLWSYRSQSSLTRDGVYDLLPGFSTFANNWEPDIGLWTASILNPGVGVNDTGGPSTFTFNTSTFIWPVNTIWMHPDPNGLVVVSWLSPTSGLADIEFNFTDMDANGGNGIGWFVDLGDNSGNLLSGSFANGGSSGTQTVNGVSVSIGDRINFIVSPPSTDHGFDSTTFTATITVPEPSTVGLAMSLFSIVLICIRNKCNTIFHV